MGRRAHVRLDDPLAPPRARLRRTHRLFRSHDPRRSRKPPAQANRSQIAVFKRTLRTWKASEMVTDAGSLQSRRRRSRREMAPSRAGAPADRLGRSRFRRYALIAE